MMITEWIPVNLITKRNIERDQCRTPPTSIPVIITARAPGPVVVVIDPAAVVIRGPTPRFVTHPRPTIRGAPGPTPITIRRPAVVVVDYGRVRPPDPAIVIRVGPIAIGIQIFGAPHVAVVILNVVTQALREIVLAPVDPVVP